MWVLLNFSVCAPSSGGPSVFCNLTHATDAYSSECTTVQYSRVAWGTLHFTQNPTFFKEKCMRNPMNNPINHELVVRLERMSLVNRNEIVMLYQVYSIVYIVGTVVRQLRSPVIRNAEPNHTTLPHCSGMVHVCTATGVREGS